jgi:hypothetical protein
MGKLCDKVLHKIKEEKISPKPRWHFLLRDCFLWLAFAVSVIVGSLAFCVIFTITLNNDWDIYDRLGRTFFQHVIFSLPYLWIILVILFLGLAFYNYKHTKEGYRYEAFTILGLSVIASIVLGALFSASGAGERIDLYLVRNFPGYEKLSCCRNRQDIWLQPEKGLLAGEIMEIEDESDFTLEDFNGFVWQVEKEPDFVRRGPVLEREGEEVKLLGEREDEFIFHAHEMRRWNGNGKAGD